MKSFKDLIYESAKFKKEKKWVPNEKGRLEKKIKYSCVDSNGQRIKNYKVDSKNKRCVKMSPAEIHDKKKTMKKVQKTKEKHSSIIAARREKIKKQRENKNL